MIGWAVENADDDDLKPTSGMKIMKAGERYAKITLIASDDLVCVVVFMYQSLSLISLVLEPLFATGYSLD